MVNMKPIYFTKHASKQMKSRGASDEEVIKVIQSTTWQPAEKERLTASLSFPFNSEHYGRFYASKEVVPIFVEERDRIVVITVYTFFSQKGVRDET